MKCKVFSCLRHNVSQSSCTAATSLEQRKYSDPMVYPLGMHSYVGHPTNRSMINIFQYTINQATYDKSGQTTSMASCKYKWQSRTRSTPSSYIDLHPRKKKQI